MSQFSLRYSEAIVWMRTNCLRKIYSSLLSKNILANLSALSVILVWISPSSHPNQPNQTSIITKDSIFSCSIAQDRWVAIGSKKPSSLSSFSWSHFPKTPFTTSLVSVATFIVCSRTALFTMTKTYSRQSKRLNFLMPTSEELKLQLHCKI